MADRSNDIGDKLRKGEKVKCPKCNKGIVKPNPSDIPLEQVHYFECANMECDFFVHFDPMVIVE